MNKRQIRNEKMRDTCIEVVRVIDRSGLEVHESLAVLEECFLGAVIAMGVNREDFLELMSASYDDMAVRVENIARMGTCH